MNTKIPFGVEKQNASFEIDRKTYKVESHNFNAIKSKKSQILLSGSLRKGNNNILRLKKKDFGLSKKWPMFTIRRDGKIYQHFDPQYYSEFMGIKDIDKKIITIQLENMGMLFFDYDHNCYINWINEICEESKVYEKLWKNNRYWETYTPEQFKSCVNLCIYLCRNYGIVQDSYGNIVIQDNAITFNGILSRSNYDSEYTDINPSFNWNKFLKELNIFI